MEQLINYIQDTLKELENTEFEKNQTALVLARLDSICALLSITLYNLKTEQNEKSEKI